MVSHQSVLGLARQGDAGAIALLLNQALMTRGVQVKATRRANRLYVLLEGEPVPDRQIYARAVYAATLCLGAASIQTIQIYGQCRGAQFPAWTQVLTLDYSSLSHSLEKESDSGIAESSKSDYSQPSVSRLQPSRNLLQKRLATKGQSSSFRDSSSERQLEGLPTSRTQHSALFSFPLQAPHYKLGLSFAALVCASFGLGAGLNYLFSKQSGQSPARSIASAEAREVQRKVNPASTARESPNLQAAIAPLPSAVASPNQTSPVITIKAVGDIIPGTNFPSDRLASDDGHSLFNDIKPYLEGADIVFGNFESTMTDYPYAAKDISQGMTFAFRTPPAYAGLLKEVGFNVLNVANNHSMDFDQQGFQDTIANIEQAGMKVVGQKGQITYLNVNGIPVAFIGFSFLDYHNSMNDLATAQALVQEAKKQAKLVVISVHEGAEGTDAIHVSDQTEFFFGENRGNSVNFAHAMIDQGADLVLGHGPHVPRALELYRGKLVAYSLGNFMGYRTLSTEATLSNSLILQVQLNAEGNFISGKIIPVALDSSGIPHLDDYFQSVVLIRNLIESDFPVTPLLIDDVGQIVKNEAPLPVSGK